MGGETKAAEADDRISQVKAQRDRPRRIYFKNSAEIERKFGCARRREPRERRALAEMNEARSDLTEDAYAIGPYPCLHAKQSLRSAAVPGGKSRKIDSPLRKEIHLPLDSEAVRDVVSDATSHA